MKRSDTTESQQALADPWILGRVVQVLVLVAFVAALTVPTGLVPIVAVAFHQDVEAVREEGPVIIPLAPIEPTATATPIYTPTPHVPRVGIIAGHSGHDTGAVCDDGLQEVKVNQAIAELVVEQLTQLGYRAEQLEEFDGRLPPSSDIGLNSWRSSTAVCKITVRMSCSRSMRIRAMYLVRRGSRWPGLRGVIFLALRIGWLLASVSAMRNGRAWSSIPIRLRST